MDRFKCLKKTKDEVGEFEKIDALRFHHYLMDFFQFQEKSRAIFFGFGRRCACEFFYLEVDLKC